MPLVKTDSQESRSEEQLRPAHDSTEEAVTEDQMDPGIAEDEIIEEISIDGMCGVY